MKAALLETAMISLQAGCSMRRGDFFFTFLFPGRIKLTSHLESKITCVTPISSELCYWKHFVLYTHTYLVHLFSYPYSNA